MKKNKVISIDKKVLPTEKTKNKILKVYDRIEYIFDIIEYVKKDEGCLDKKILKEKYHKDLIYIKHKSKKKLNKLNSLFWQYRKKIDKLKSQLKMSCCCCGVNYVDFICYDYNLCKDCQTDILDFIDSSIENKENE